MGLPTITFTKAQGGLGRPLPGDDYISGMVFYDSTLPSGFTTSANIKQIFQIQDAEALGIGPSSSVGPYKLYPDATLATGVYTVTGAGASGDTFVIKVLEPTGYVILGTYTRLSTDTTTSLVAAGIAAAINSGTSVHGYTASVASAVITITARPGLGIFLNSGTPIVATITGTIAGAITQFSGGVASKLSIYHYHIAEYFRIQPKGNLFVAFFPVPGSYTFTELITLQNFAQGIIKLCAVYVPLQPHSTAYIQTLQAIQVQLENLYKPMSILYAGDLTAVTDLSTLTDLRTLNSYAVTGVIGQDGGANGAALYAAYGKSISNIGAALGAVSFSAVSESITWRGNLNMSDGTELEVPAFSNGVLVKNVYDGLQGQLCDRGFLFLVKMIGTNGTFNSDSPTSISVNSDYAYIENVRTIFKAIRQTYIKLSPLVGSPLDVNSDGTLSDNTIAIFSTAAESGLDQMVRDADLSGREVLINSNQNVLSTSAIAISIQLLGVGVARKINVTIGYVQKLS